ncbi:MAG: DNA repair protein RecO [Candidatus Buchananbacteria bacterium CG10_big_fil_rev_8_21_14_0_10_42_9]|uniref:DNA repair protein RecO n=1 Tax=Candidatus Buchananbacteria bacterium CG10_big_fil_rev_8_21_14_0_10_42_9 TaxID=1974526 RepID=A0A2H0W261_9BACT|nr:MAG: DNA repair protein RecO [Candidatus Buchananbacteria bacterium CG10_big_fil_rev_8_21_14_0_10_42_9]
MSYNNSTAIVLRQVDWQEHDRLVTLFTYHLGKVSAICQGAKKSTSKLGSHLQPFALIDIELVQGKQWQRIINIGQTKFFNNMTSALPRQMVGYFWLECVDKLTHEHSPEPKLFQLLADAFEALDRLPLDKLRLIRSAFIFKLLDISGYGFKFKHPQWQKVLRQNISEIEVNNWTDRAINELGQQSLKILQDKLDQPLKTLITVRDLTPLRN